MARRTIMEMDPPQHSRYRRLVSRPFSPRAAVPSTRARCASSRCEVLDEVGASLGSTSSPRWARQLPMKMPGGGCSGCPARTSTWLVDRGDALIGNTDADFTDFVVDQVDTSDYRLLPFRSPVSLELFDFADGALAERREHPTDDVLTSLLQPTVDGDLLDDDQLKNFFNPDGGRRQRHHPLLDGRGPEGTGRAAGPAA